MEKATQEIRLAQLCLVTQDNWDFLLGKSADEAKVLNIVRDKMEALCSQDRDKMAHTQNRSWTLDLRLGVFSSGVDLQSIPWETAHFFPMQNCIKEILQYLCNGC